MNLEKWKSFFNEAGVPSNDAATYAFKFAHNRIQTDMLVDLNKDYLKDMGITIMGDVIAILRHAKQVYEDIQKTSKTILLEEPKKKEKIELLTKLSKKLSAEPNATKISDVPKPVSKPAMKRKSESAGVPLQKTASDPLPKKPKVAVTDDNIEECEDLGYVMIDSSKKSILFNKTLPKNVESQLKMLRIEKSEKIPDIDSHHMFQMSEDDDDDNVEVIINDPIVTPFSGYKKFPSLDTSSIRAKECVKNTSIQDLGKRTVFKRLGDEISQPSVTSTTPFEEEDQLPLSSRKSREDTAKSVQEKNSVFHRLGQKCDVSSTSADSVEDKKPLKSDLRDSLSKTIVVTSVPKQTITRKVKIEKNDDSKLVSIKSTYSEGILAGNGSARKLSLKERMGLPKNASNFKVRSETEYRKETIRRVSDGFFSREKISSVKKRVSFGTVSQKLIPSREEAIRTGELPSAAEERTSVFDRLGFNRTF